MHSAKKKKTNKENSLSKKHSYFANTHLSRLLQYKLSTRSHPDLHVGGSGAPATLQRSSRCSTKKVDYKERMYTKYTEADKNAAIRTFLTTTCKSADIARRHHMTPQYFNKLKKDRGVKHEQRKEFEFAVKTLNLEEVIDGANVSGAGSPPGAGSGLTTSNMDDNSESEDFEIMLDQPHDCNTNDHRDSDRVDGVSSGPLRSCADSHAVNQQSLPLDPTEQIRKLLRDTLPERSCVYESGRQNFKLELLGPDRKVDHKASYRRDKLTPDCFKRAWALAYGLIELIDDGKTYLLSGLSGRKAAALISKDLRVDISRSVLQRACKNYQVHLL